MLLRFVNTCILTLTVILALTGVYGLIFTLNEWLFDIHRIAGWALIGLMPWKAGISWRSLKRGFQPNFKRGVMMGISLLLAAMAVTALILSVQWAWRIEPVDTWLYQTFISWHWILALILLIPFTIHVFVRWPRPKWREIASRRGALRALALAAAGVGGWWIAESLATTRATSESPRTLTGSRGARFLSGNAFPITGEWAQEIDPRRWNLTVSSPLTSTALLLTYDRLLKLPRAETDVTLDCTTGWYSHQRWSGIPLMALLSGAQFSAQVKAVVFTSTTGYAESFLIDEARSILLATHVGWEPLSHWHGFPLRAVVPSRRGWFWVKWINKIEFLDTIPLDFPDFR